MRKVDVEIEELPGCTVATCGDCDHSVEVSTEDPEGRHAVLEKLARTCPMREQNRYVPVD